MAEGGEHRIVLFYLGRERHIAVSCTCLKLGRRGHVPLAEGVRLPAPLARAAYAAHMTTMRETDERRSRTPDEELAVSPVPRYRLADPP